MSSVYFSVVDSYVEHDAFALDSYLPLPQPVSNNFFFTFLNDAKFHWIHPPL